MNPMLEVRGVTKAFGNLIAVREVSLTVAPGELRAIIGHAASFWTWRSLCLDQHLSDTEAVQAMTTLALATAGMGQAAGASRARLPSPDR